MEKDFDLSGVHDAIRCCFADCDDHRERCSAGDHIIEFLTAFNFTDDEIIDALKASDGMDAEADDYIDEMIARIRQ